MELKSIEDFYKDLANDLKVELDLLIPDGISKEIGHFNVFKLDKAAKQAQMPYDRRLYYKISLIRGQNRAEYADRIIEIKKNGLLFASPKVPYYWRPIGTEQSYNFCVFTHDFFTKKNGALPIDELPIFKAGGYPIFEISDEEADEIEGVFKKMHRDINTDYAFKYDLLRNYAMELVHFGQKLQPASELRASQNASSRISALFVELLERQFPIETVNQRLALRTPNEYAERLSVHVNHLNKVLKQNMGNTTSTLINARIIREAKILLKQTDWSVSEIAFALGFDEVAHFSNFFKKRVNAAPLAFRE